MSERKRKARAAEKEPWPRKPKGPKTREKHVWLLTPTKLKADRLMEGFRAARKAGVTAGLARCFAGYYGEWLSWRYGFRDRPESEEHPEGDPRGWFLTDLLERCVRGGFRIARGRYATEYELAFVRHLPFWVGPLAESVGLAKEAPWYAVRDRLLEEGRGGEWTEELAAMCEGTCPEGKEERDE
jgi:hypothetical protein